MDFVLLVSVLFLATQARIRIIRTKEIFIDMDFGHLIRLVTTSHTYLPFCRHIIPKLQFISVENIFEYPTVSAQYMTKTQNLH